MKGASSNILNGLQVFNPSSQLCSFSLCGSLSSLNPPRQSSKQQQNPYVERHIREHDAKIPPSSTITHRQSGQILIARGISTIFTILRSSGIVHCSRTISQKRSKEAAARYVGRWLEDVDFRRRTNYIYVMEDV